MFPRGSGRLGSKTCLEWLDEESDTECVGENPQGRHTSGGGKAIKGNTQEVKFWVILQWFLSMAIEKKTFSGETFLREFYICSPFLHNLLQISKNSSIFSFQ